MNLMIWQTRSCAVSEVYRAMEGARDKDALMRKLVEALDRDDKWWWRQRERTSLEWIRFLRHGTWAPRLREEEDDAVAYH